jgi:serine/threonine protein kinase
VRVGSYEILSELGRGGMGVVYRARSPEGSEVALKLLLRADPATVARFERERRLLGALEAEDGFVKLIDAGSSAQGPFLVMPLLTGGTLAERLRRGKLGVEETLALGRRLARALSQAHARGIVHRDVKPSNIIFASDGRAFLADLGLGKVSAATGSLTGTGTFLGTLGYVPPEQLDGSRDAGPRSDVFSLGAVLHECLSGRPPFPQPGIVSYVKAIESGPPPLVEGPAWLRALVARALASDPPGRPADGLAFLAALEPPRRPRRRWLVALPVLALALVGAGVLLRPAAPLPAPAALPPRPEEPPADVIRRALERRYADPKGARAALAALIGRAPDLAAAWSARSEVELVERDHEAALADARKAVALEPRSAAPLAQIAHVHLERREEEKAIEQATLALGIDGGCARALAWRAFAHTYRHDRRRAREDAANAFRADPDDEVALLARLLNVLGHEDLGEAYPHIEHVLAVSPASPFAWAAHGMMRLARGERAAFEELDRACALGPREQIVVMTRCQARLLTKDTAGAFEDAKTLLEIDPRTAFYWDHAFKLAPEPELGLLVSRARSLAVERIRDAWLVKAVAEGLARAGDVPGAVELYAAAAAASPDSVAVAGEHALFLMNVSRVEEALPCFDRAIELSPGDASLRYYRAAARWEGGDRRGAREDLRFAEAMQPGAELEAKLRELRAQFDERERVSNPR